MMKKGIIFLFILEFLYSAIVLDYANAMGSSSMSNETVAIICAVTIVITVVLVYYIEWSDHEKTEKKASAIKEIIERHTAQSGNILVFKW